MIKELKAKAMEEIHISSSFVLTAETLFIRQRKREK
jgi:hypothetical protein